MVNLVAELKRVSLIRFFYHTCLPVGRCGKKAKDKLFTHSRNQITRLIFKTPTARQL